MIKNVIHQEDITVLNGYAPKIAAKPNKTEQRKIPSNLKLIFWRKIINKIVNLHQKQTSKAV